MWCRLLVSFSLCLTFKHVQARIKKVEERECRNVHQGKELTLTSVIEPLTRCYFVSTDSDSGDQCCFNEDGKDEDCTTSGYYKQRNTKCPEYSLTYDSIETRTCTLTIKSVSAAGKYKSFDANHVPLQSCLVTVSDGELKGEFIFGIGFTLALLLFLVFLVVFLRLKSSQIKEILRRKDCQRIITILQCVRLLSKDNDDEDQKFYSVYSDEEAANPRPNPIGQEAESMKLVKAGPEADGNKEGVISFLYYVKMKI